MTTHTHLQTRRAQLSHEKQALLRKRLHTISDKSEAQSIIPKRTTDASAPLSYAQQGLWFLYQLDPVSSAYHMTDAFRVTGMFQVEAYRRSVQAVAERHEALRTVFALHDDQPTQMVSTVADPFMYADRSPQSDCEVDLHAEITKIIELPFDLEHGPLWRVVVLKLAPDEHVIVIVIHHIICDAWSWDIMMRDLNSFYASFMVTTDVDLTPLPLQYIDYTHWQHEQLQSDRCKSQIAYWMQRLDAPPEPLALPTDKPRPDNLAHHDWHLLTLPQSLAYQLDALSRGSGVTLFTTLLTAFNILLYRYTGSHDILVGSPIAHRNYPELEHIMGIFVNMIPLRNNLAGNPSFRDLLKQVQKRTLEDFDNQDIPIEKLIELLQLERHLNRPPLFQTVFVLQNTPQSESHVPGLTTTPVSTKKWTTQFDLTLEVIDTNKEFSASIEYNADIFDKTTIARIGNHFHTLLISLLRNPDQSIAELAILPSEERHQILTDWSTRLEHPNTFVDIPGTPKRQYILDAYLEPVPIGVMGELYVTTDERDINSDNKPLPDLFNPDSSGYLYKTGKQAYYRADGVLIIQETQPAPSLSHDVLPDLSTPTNLTESLLVQIWADLLDQPRIAMNKNFFELGGHSLLATQLISRIRETFQIDLPLRVLFSQDATVSHLARIVEETVTTGEQQHLPVLQNDLAHRYDPFPLTDLQQAYWIGQTDLFELGNLSGHMYNEFDLINLDIHRLVAALNRLIQHQEMLRVIVRSDGQQQILADVPSYPLVITDLRGYTPELRAEKLEQIREHIILNGPTTDEWPLFNIQAHILDEERIRLHLSISLIICDGRSFELFMQQMLYFYQDPQATIAPLAISYRDYIMALRSYNEQAEAAHTYWSERLATLPPAPELPLAKSPASIATPRFRRRSAKIPAEVWQQLKARATKAKLTTNNLICTAFTRVLATWSKNQHFTLNVLLGNRLPIHSQVNQMIGNCTTNTLLEVNFANTDNFSVQAQRLQEQLLHDIEHHAVSGVDVLRNLARTRGWTSRAISPVVFISTLHLGTNWQNQDPPILEGETVFNITQTSQIWLEHQVYEDVEGLGLNWDVVEELFPTGMIDSMFDTYCALLYGLAQDDALWEDEQFAMLPDDQRAMRAMINETSAPIPDGLLCSPFLTQVQKRPDGVAIVSPHCTITYAALDQAARRLSYAIHRQNIASQDVVAVVMEKGWEQIVAVLGILYTGAIYVPIDPTLPTERRRHLLNHTGAKLVLTQPWIDEQLDWDDSIQRLCITPTSLAAVDDERLSLRQSSKDIAYIIYTSGSTGLPKGVVINHQAALNTVVDINRRFQIVPHDRLLAISSLSFDLSVYDIFGILGAGATLIMPTAASARDPLYWAEVVMHEQVTIWNSVPALVEVLVGHVIDDPTLVISSLRVIMMSGDWIPINLPPRLNKLTPHAQLISMGGATEAAIWSIIHPINEIDPTWTSIPYGTPLLNQQWHILDHALQPCPDWVPGYLYIGGIGLAQGYWNNEERTNASFITHPQTGERLYRTGDLGRYCPNGVIEFLGREDLQVKIRGYRVELGEIEAVLNQVTEVREALVVVREDQPGDKRLVAYVVLDREMEVTGIALRETLQRKLPTYMIPTVIVFLDELPLTVNGKIDRKRLPAPDIDRPLLTKGYMAPRNGYERELSQIWEAILGIQPIGIHDTFFELGGTSLAAVRLIAAIQDHFGCKLPLVALLEGATIETQAHRLQGGLSLTG